MAPLVKEFQKYPDMDTKVCVTTERPEDVDAGTVILVGTNKELIIEECHSLLIDSNRYTEMTSLQNPYGDGKASERMACFINGL
jgi:UDP-N-acetylglucosamine 2-epimerase (non-hydrolysing)